jgi:HK97 gp10 family phage protein
MPVPIKAQLTGVAELLKRFAGTAKVMRAASRKGVNEATKLVLASAKSFVPQRTGSLRKSLGRKVVAMKNGGGYVGVVGPRKDMSDKERARRQQEFEQGKRKRAPGKAKFRRVVKYKGKEITVNPVHYAHLVEYGTAPHGVKGKKVLSGADGVFGTRTSGSKPRPFLRPAWESNKAACEGMILQSLREALTQAGK